MEISQAATANEVLRDVRELRAVSLAADAALLRQAACWADLHPADDPDLVATSHERGRDTGMTLTADGLPDVSAGCVAELAAALGMATRGGERLIAHALELRHRLPRLWSLVQDGEVAAWQARRVADQTLSLTADAAAFVDSQVAAVVGRVGSTQLDRLIQTALVRHMPDEAERRRVEAAEGRCFEVAHDRAGRQQGLSDVWGRLDLPDALALDAAVSDGAHALGLLGSTESLGVRRARAVGDLARRQPGLDLLTQHVTSEPGPTTTTGPWTTSSGVSGAEPENARSAAKQVELGPVVPGSVVPGSVEPGSAEPRSAGIDVGRAGSSPFGAGASRPGPGGRAAVAERVVLYLHLSEQALRTGVEDGSARTENTGCPVTAEQIREWCARPGAWVSVRPVIDLAAESVVPGYDIPERLREHVALRDRSCVFPYCSRPAHPYPTRRVATDRDECGWRVDTDHIEPYESGGATSSDNLAPLCRIHHWLKTFAGWRYRVTGSRSYVWTSPQRLRYLRTPDGATHDLGGPEPGAPLRRPRALEPPRRTTPLPYETESARSRAAPVAVGADPPPF